MNRRTDLLVTMVLIFAIFILGCGGGGSSSGGGGTDSTANVSGTWKGTGNSKETGTAPTTLILSQSGNNVSGTWDGYAVTGTVSGNQLNLTFTPFTQSGVSFTGSGNATVTGNSMSGTFALTGKLGGNSVTINATFDATRSNAKIIPGYNPAGGLVTAAVGAISN
jgi:hypothetical protein